MLDAASNPGATGAAYSIKIDTVAPTQTVTSITVTDDVLPVMGSVPDGGTTNDTAPLVSGTLSAALSAGESVQVLRESSDGTSSIGTAIVTGLSWRYDDSGLANGNTYTYTARVLDAAGNQGPDSAKHSIKLDTVAPTVTAFDILDNVGAVQGSVGNGDTTDDNTPTLKLTFSEVFGVGASLEVRLNGVPIVGGTIEPQVDPHTVHFLGPDPLSDGTYTYTAQMTDAAGNVGGFSASYKITIDTTP